MLPKTGATRPVAGTRARRHVATHRARRHRETELHAKFGRDALLTPRAIRGGHLDDEAPEGDSCRVIDAWGGPRIRYRTRACLRGNKFSAASCARDRKVDRDSRKRSVSRASTVRITCEEISGDGQVPGAVDELAQPVSVACQRDLQARCSRVFPPARSAPEDVESAHHVAAAVHSTGSRNRSKRVPTDQHVSASEAAP